MALHAGERKAAHAEEHLVRLPVRSRRTMARSGTGLVEASVFCPLLARSVPLDLCEHCTRCRRVEYQGSGAIACDIELPRDDGQPRVDVAEAAARTFVGQVMTMEVVCVHEDVSAALVVELLHAGADCLPVVTSGGRLVGVVCPRVLLRAWPSSAEPPTAGALARPAPEVLGETTPLSLAIGALARAGDVPLPVVSAAGAVTGLLSPADVVRWMSVRMGYGTP